MPSVRRSLRLKMLSVAFIAAVSGILITGVSVWSMIGLKGHITHLTGSTISDINYTSHVQEGILRERIAILSYVNSTSQQAKQGLLDELKAARELTDRGLEGLTGTAWDADAQKAKGLVQEYRTMIDGEYIPAADAGDLARVEELRSTQAAPLVTQITETLTAIDQGQVEDTALVAAQASKQASEAPWYVAGVMAVGLVLIVTVAFKVSGSILTSVRKVSETLEALGSGDLTAQVEVRTKDEVGVMAERLNKSIQELHEALSEVSENASALAERSTDMLAAAGRIAGSAQDVSGSAGEASAVAGQVNSSLESIAAGAEEMGASIKEISRGANEAATIAAEAVSVAAKAETSLAELEKAREEIGGFVRVITQIAEQTNLLALNATIEAARAGEAGKGFAVVANEVKELSKASADASEDISARVRSINTASVEVRDGVAEMAEFVEKISAHQTSIAGAVEEQTATTSEMSRSVNQIVAGTNGIVGSMTTITVAAADTNQDAAQSRVTADQVASMSEKLQALVARFKI